MKTILIIVALLLGGYAVALLLGVEESLAGRIGISAVFYFTALGHFAKAGDMMQMIPARVPQRRLLVWLSGVFEALLATAVLFDAFARMAGIAICVFLVAVTPLNIYSAVQRVPFGGHAAGPRYLAIRLPLQVLLFVWTYWFTLR